MSTATASLITVRPAPRSEPPGHTEPRPRHLRLVVDSPELPFEIPQRRAEKQREPQSRPGRANGLPDIRDFATQYARAVSEILTGHRGIEFLRRYTTLGTFEWIRSLAPGSTVRRDLHAPPPQVLAVHACAVRDGICEVSAIIQRGPRVRAMTLRFIELDRRWQCCHLEVI